MYVGDRDQFAKMIEYFEQDAAKIDIVGLDCEWKPIFDEKDEDGQLDELSNGAANEKNKRPNLLQVATREKTFLIEFRDLPDSLDDELVDKFGQLLFFSENVLKLGYAFDQDGRKLSHVFPKFQHKFSDFVDSVVNIDFVVSDVNMKI